MTETERCEFVYEAAPAKASSGLWNRIAAVIDYIDACLETRRQRRALAVMDNHQLKDIGLNRADVDGEASRSFWDVSKR